MSWLFSPPRKGQPRLLSDEVVPVHFFDNTQVNRQLFVCWTLRFDDVLNVDKVHDSLSRLLEIGDWRKLGGRLRMNDAGQLEIHIPRHFTKDRPAVRFSRTTFEISMYEHPVASKLPRRMRNPSLQPGPEEFRTLAYREDMPMTLENHLCSDEPQLQLHTASFVDGTLVSLTWPHIMTDAMGLMELAKAWSLVMHGREAEVPPFLGLKEDPLATVGRTAPWPNNKESLPLVARYELLGCSLLRALAWFVPTQLWWPAYTSKTIFLPASTVRKLRECCMKQVAIDKEGGTMPFISENDVITAWLARTASAHLSTTAYPNILIQNVYDIRSRLSTLSQQSKLVQITSTSGRPGVFVQNLVAPTVTLLPTTQVLYRPLGRLALDFRSSIAEQVTEEQTEKLFSMLRGSYATRGRAPIFGSPDAFWLLFTSWVKCNVCEEVDFGAAGQGKRGKPSYFHSFPVVPPWLAPNGFQVAGKDDDGNFWVVGNLQAGLWKNFEEELAILGSS
ncbi:uncharacterized protein BCR38DRAFT_336233 [Pseudomassariella vexata]|uniref:Transferase family-domain-containing protein n=1 Tax=Pseudomassariella vexata TaxID=1141098 RepID=A0A1Y2E9I1_9PEZI|nr:uncharacterized protein BCR38DRAFT_336233 [Pseudomassariella vexata]ORY68233.1 hypothetical protein BCR38DRAFT_336233 [Pseudomassariella vexata]